MQGENGGNKVGKAARSGLTNRAGTARMGDGSDRKAWDSDLAGNGGFGTTGMICGDIHG